MRPPAMPMHPNTIPMHPNTMPIHPDTIPMRPFTIPMHRDALKTLRFYAKLYLVPLGTSHEIIYRK